jgi:GNAT superfamily N-acetyltransferase
MIGVEVHERGVGEIRRLRVREDARRRGIGTRLMEVAVKFCADQQVLKLTLDTFIDREPAIKLFEKFRFRHDRTKKVGEKDLLYFYLDIYGRDRGPQQE